MMITEHYADLCEKYNEVVNLLEQSKFDPREHPYVSKYAAMELLVDMKTNLEKLKKKSSVATEELLKITAMLGTVYLYLGTISIDIEEFSAGETYLHRCNNIIKEYSGTSQVIMITLNMWNQFGILWSEKQPEKSKAYLEQAEKSYLEFKTSCCNPTDISELFCRNSEKISDNSTRTNKNFEKIYTLTLYYLAQIHGALKDVLKSSVYCHITLQRQLDSEDYDPIDWALNCATLSQFFMERNGFKQSRHHLAASCHILKEYEKTLNAITERSEDLNAKLEVFKHRSADVARCCGKYGLLLLWKSKERLLSDTVIDNNSSLSSDFCNLSLDSSSITLEKLQNLKFTSLDLTEYETQITDKFVLTIHDARPVFLYTQTWLNKAESYYTLDKLASDYLEIVQDKSQMYLNLLFFEDNMENQAKLHKRRVDLLEHAVNKVNPQYYLQYCRQIWFELAQTYSDMLNIKSDKLRELKGRPSPHILSKINHLTERSICNFTYFVNSFKEGVRNDFSSRVPAESEKAFLQACFHIAALNNKYITTDKRAQLINTENSYRAYKKTLDYCNLNDKAIVLIPIEYGICKEMVVLLPIKIAKLTRELL